MGKKQKSKDRLDKFYYMAKEHGFRSRAAFKLIQLNKKYDFLSKTKCLVDLCAAPGGWLQVAAKYMPLASIKIGVDLAPIKPIKGCLTFQADITTERCVNLIRKELKHFKADVVLNDGAPNVGAEWTKDAFNQAELCLYALKLATQVLRKGGTFITKVFRSKDYNSLLFVFNHLFNRVEATKPQASRTQSAEIFVVCQGYKDPDTIDPKFLDPKFAFEDVEEEAENSNKVSSLKKLLDKKVNRSGYNEKRGQSLYLETQFIEFLESADPYEYLATYNKFIIDDRSKTIFKNQVPPPEDIELLCADIKVLGKRELHSLLKYRYKYQMLLEKQKKKEKEQILKLEKENNKEEMTEADIEKQIDKELEETIKRVEKEKKKQEKKEKEKKSKSELRQKMSVIASSDIHNENDEVLFDRKTFEKIQDLDIEDDDYVDDDEEEEVVDQNPLKIRQYGKELEELKNDKENEDDDEDYEVKRIDMMNEEIENLYQQKKEYQMEKDKKLAKKEKKRLAQIEKQRKQVEELSEEEKMLNDDVQEVDHEDNDYEQEDVDNEEDEDEEDEAIEVQKSKKASKKQVKFDNSDDENEEQDSDIDDKPMFLNPLLLVNKQQNKSKGKISQDIKDQVEEEEQWSADEEDQKQLDKEKKKDKKILGKRQRKVDEDPDMKDFFHNNDFEVVPEQKIGKEDDEMSLDSDEMAETRALAKLMLRKKTRTQILDSSYNRYANFDDPNILPKWFVDEEKKHYRPNLPITKEMIIEEKRILKEYDERPSKKVAEAKARKKKRLAKAMAKVKSKAQVIAEQEDIKEGSKMRQIQKIYRKELNKFKEEKKYVVNRNFNNVGQAKTPRNVKLVDKRMKKDLRKQKQSMKKGGKGGGGKKGKGGGSKRKGRK